MSPLHERLNDRGFVQQMTSRDAFVPGSKFYIGFDPTGESLHVGHLLQMMVARHIAEAGHEVVLLVGGATAMIGDPTGKDQTRLQLDQAEVARNAESIGLQLRQFCGDDGVTIVNNLDWFQGIGYIDFLRTIGRHFSVNQMLTAAGTEQRLARGQGMSFIEFNYHLFQSFDFLHLWREQGCNVQVGGNDQWFNILGGVELIRREAGATVHGVTTPLLTTAGGKKMGKTENGAVFLDPSKTTPFQFFQFWVNVDDADVGKFLRLFTFLPLDEIDRLVAGDVRDAKRELAFRVTQLVHGDQAAEQARADSNTLFRGAAGKVSGARCEVSFPITVVDAMVGSGLAQSRSDARRLIMQRGVRVGADTVTSLDAVIEQPTILRRGKAQAVSLEQA